MRVRSYPGANTFDLYNKIWSRELDVSKHSLLICSIGTNDLCNLKVDAHVIAQAVMYLFHTIKEFNPQARLMYVGILIRPKDIGGILEQRRKVVNKLIQRYCRQEGVHFLRAWRSMTNGEDLKARAYAKDGLHLSRTGARYLYRYIEGNIRTVEGFMKL